MTTYDASGNLAPARRSKYRRPRQPISWLTLLIGAAVGIGSGLFYAWVIDPRIEYDTEPWQLRSQDRANYIVAITLQYAYDGDLNHAIQRLVEIQPQTNPKDPIQEVADVACQLATTGFVDNSSGLRAIRAMMLFYQLQGRTGCADNLIPASESTTEPVQIEAATPTPVPPASKTPTPASGQRPSPTPPRVIVPTIQPQSTYELVDIRTFCDTELSGIIEVFVQDFNGEGISGEAVRVRWDGGEDTFFTGLKPERGPGYADFQMQESKGYIIEMPGQSDPSSQPLLAAPCFTDGGEQSLRSYRVFFRPSG